MSSQPREPMSDSAADLAPMRDALANSEAPLTVEASVFDAVVAEAAHEERAWFGAMRARPTWLRRAVVCGVLVVIAGLNLCLGAREAFELAPLRVGVSLAVFGGLMLLTVLLSQRPLHQPALSRAREVMLLSAPLAIALGLSLWPTEHANESFSAMWHGALPCFVYGAIVALPVYAIARALDRGAWLTGFLAAIAAGLFANFALTTHCPLASADHMLLGHFSVLLAGLATYTTCTAYALRSRSPQRA